MTELSMHGIKNAILHYLTYDVTPKSLQTVEGRIDSLSDHPSALKGFCWLGTVSWTNFPIQYNTIFEYHIDIPYTNYTIAKTQNYTIWFSRMGLQVTLISHIFYVTNLCMLYGKQLTTIQCQDIITCLTRWIWTTLVQYLQPSYNYNRWK